VLSPGPRRLEVGPRRHWLEPLQATIQPLEEAYQFGLQSGDLEYAGMAIVFSQQHALLCGRELRALEKSLASYAGSIKRINHETSWIGSIALRQTTWNLLNATETPWILSGEFCDEDETLRLLTQHAHQPGQFYVQLLRLMLACWFGRYEEGLQIGQDMEKIVPAAGSMYMQRSFFSYQSLVCLGHYPQVGKAAQRRLLLKVQKNQRRIHKWLAFQPANQLHLYLLVEACRFQLQKKRDRALQHFELARTQARAQGFVHEEGLAGELSGTYLMDCGRPQDAVKQLRDARFAYLKWGAATKVRDLEQRFPGVFS